MQVMGARQTSALLESIRVLQRRGCEPDVVEGGGEGKWVESVTEGGRHSLALGHGLRWEALVMGDAMANKTAYLPGNSWILFDFPGCEGRGLWCHLHPVADCRPGPKTRQSEVRVTHVHRVWPIPREWVALGHFGWSSALLGAVVSPRPYMVRCPIFAGSKPW